MRRLAPSILCVAWLVASSGAAAQPSQAAAAAAALFERGLADMQAGKYDTGCPALHESYRFDPRPGALFTAAECDAKWGKAATALAGYTDFLAIVGHMSDKDQGAHAKRTKIASEQKTRLAAIVPKLVLVFSPSAGAGVDIVLDGSPIGAPSLGVPLPVDPGEHRIVVRNKDGAREHKVTAAEGEEKRVELALPDRALPAPLATPAPTPPLTTPTPTEPAEQGPKRRPLAYASLAIGALGLGAGAVGGGLTLAAKSTIDQQCSDVHCTPEGKSAADRAQVTGLVSTIGFIAGGAFGALGVILLATDPAHPARPRAGVAFEAGPTPRASLVGSF